MTTATTIYSPGDIVLVPFPFTNLSAAKERPALVISGRDFNKTQEDIILLAITSNPHAEKRGQYTYSLEKIDCKSAGLFFPSFVKTAKIISLDQRLIRKLLGRISRASTEKFIREFQRILGRL